LPEAEEWAIVKKYRDEKKAKANRKRFIPIQKKYCYIIAHVLQSFLSHSKESHDARSAPKK